MTVVPFRNKRGVQNSGTTYYSIDFTKDELIYLSLALREYQRSEMITAWDMERGSRERIPNRIELAEKAVVATERIAGIIELRLLNILEE